MRKHTWPIRCCFMVLFFSILAVPAMAQKRSAGVRAGISASPPNQFYVGVQVMAGEIVKDFWFRPNAEIGFGNSVTEVGLNGEFVYVMRLPKNDWTPYFGGGPALNITTIHGGAPLNNNTNVGPGFNFLAGIGKTKGLFAEIKVGALDSPEFKFGIGYTFR